MTDKKFLSLFPSLAGKRVALSGSTGGIGRHLARYFLLLGAALYLLDRNKERSLSLKQGLLAEFPDAEIELITVDFSDEASVVACGARLRDIPLDFLVLNAGAYKIPRSEGKSGYNNIFLINYASPYCLVKRLLPTLRKNKTRVVAVGSIAHRYSKTSRTDIDFGSKGADSLVYGNAKRRLMLSLYSLFENERDATLSVAHPGITFTNITNHYPKLIFALIKHPMKVIFMPPKTACLSILRGLFDECKSGEWLGPRFFDIWGMPRKSRLKITDGEIESVAREADEIYGRFCRAGGGEETENVSL